MKVLLKTFHLNGNTIGFHRQTQTQTFLSPSNFSAMADISFNIAFKELKIAQIAQGNQFFQLLNYVSSYTCIRLLWVKSYANEEKCKRWLQQSYWKVSLWDLLTPFPCALQAHFFCKIQQNGYKVLYLSARAIGQVRTSLTVSFNTDRKERDKQRVHEREWARGLR